MKTIGQAMREQREKRSLSRERLAADAGISASSLGLYERDQAVPGALALIALSDALGISIDEYLGVKR